MTTQTIINSTARDGAVCQARQRREPIVADTERRSSGRPRIRTIKPEMWQDEELGRVSRDARLLFTVLISLADDEGRFRALPAVILGHGYPYDPDAPVHLETWMGELTASQLLVLYDSRGVRYGFLPGFGRHQHVNKPSRSDLPKPPANTTHSGFPESSGTCPGSIPVGRDRKGRDLAAAARETIDTEIIDADTALATFGVTPSSALPSSLGAVIAIALDAQRTDRSIVVSDSAIDSALRAHPDGDHGQAAHLASADLTSGRRTTRHFHVVLADRLRDQTKPNGRPGSAAARSERDQRAAEDLAALQRLQTTTEGAPS